MRGDGKIAQGFGGIASGWGLCELRSAEHNQKTLYSHLSCVKEHLPVQTLYQTKLLFTYLLTATQMRSSVKRQYSRIRHCTFTKRLCHVTRYVWYFYKLTTK